MVVRSAVVADVPAIQRLINGYADSGVMLPRSLHSIYGQVRDHLVALEDGVVVGCVALSVVWQDLAEVRSLAVAQSHGGRDIGTTLVSRALDEARTLGVNRVFVLTYVEKFFRRFGFHSVEKSELPHKIWRECVHCVHFPDCDETALVIDLAPVTPD
ncbi:MAG: N-acetyltransferase [Actinobacteria bacterium]|nr:N-acetyltransferase [Actinomycetota bacterium]